MTYSRNSTRRASSSLSQRGSSKTGRHRSLVSQPVNMIQIYIRGQMHTSDQPLTSSFNCGTIEGTQRSFPSHLSTHPSCCYPNYASEPSSGFTSELGSLRALSLCTPSTPSNSNQEEPQEFFGETPLCRQPSPSDPEGALRGIGGSSCKSKFSSAGVNRTNLLTSHTDDNVTYDTEGTLGPNPPHDSRHSSSFRYSEERLDCVPGISAEIPPPTNRYQEPWSSQRRQYNGPSRPSDVVQESRVFQQYPRRQQEGSGRNIYQGHTNNQQHCHQSATCQDPIYRENGTAYGSSPGSSSSAYPDSPASDRTVAQGKIGKRKGPLSKAGRENARFMRKVGCCYRCFIMKERCILDEQSVHDKICVRCRKLLNSSRTWLLPCTQEGLEKRDKFVVPGFMADQLNPSQVAIFITAHVKSVRENSSISLSLTVGIGQKLILENAVEVVLENPEAVSMHAVRPAHSAPTPLVKLNSPPILPCLADPKALERHFNNWLDAAIQEPNSELPGKCFPEAHEHWQRTILTIICEYYQRTMHKLETTAYQMLQEALKLTLLNHLMCHPFLVPKEEVGRLNGQLQGSYPFDAEKSVCPRLVNKVIKSMLLPLLNRLAACVLRNLHHLLRTRGKEESLWDPLFCTVFLCLIVVGKFQVSFLERVEVGLMNRDYSFLRNDAVDGIKDMERELSIHLVGQFHARFGTNRQRNGHGKMFNPLARDRTPRFSWLADEVRLATETYGMSRSPHQDQNSKC